MFLIEYIKKYKVTYISVVATFLIGICIGIFVTFKIPEKDKNSVNQYLQDTVKIINEKKVDKQFLPFFHSHYYFYFSFLYIPLFNIFNCCFKTFN